MILAAPENSIGHRPWQGATYRLQRAGSRGWRRVQFTSLLLARSYWGLMKSWNWWDIIDEHFLLGGIPMFDDLDRLHGQGVQAVVNLCAERHDDQQRLQQAQMEYLWLPVPDAAPPTLEQIHCGVAWLEQQRLAERTVYIHCAAGVGRSATLLACWYLYASSMGIVQVLRFLKTRRPQITLTRRQVQRLHEFAAFSPPQVRPLAALWPPALVSTGIVFGKVWRPANG